MNTSARLCAWGLGVLVALGSTARAEGPQLNIPTAAAETGLTDAHRKQIEAYLKYWVDALVEAEDLDRVLAVRGQLREGYDKAGTRAEAYQMAYAEALDPLGKKLLTGGLKVGDPLRQFKEVSLAVVVLRIGQIAIQPLAEAMVVDSNPAMRYFGWYSYVQLRGPALQQGGKAADLMFKAVAKADAEEKDSWVIVSLMGVMQLPAKPVETVAESTYRDAQRRFFTILKANWTAQCRRVLVGDEAMAESAMKGLAACRTLVEGLGSAQADVGAALQMALNMAWSAGKAYDRGEQFQRGITLAKAAAKAADEASLPGAPPEVKASALRAAAEVKDLAEKLDVDPKTLEADASGAERAISASALLLQECEQTLNTLTGRNERFIDRPLRNPNASDRGAAVQLGVLKWVELLASRGIKSPQLVVPPPAPPAKKPAPAPTTAKAGT